MLSGGSAKVRKRLSVVGDNVLIEGLEKASLEVNEMVRQSFYSAALARRQRRRQAVTTGRPPGRDLMRCPRHDPAASAAMIGLSMVQLRKHARLCDTGLHAPHPLSSSSAISCGLAWRWSLSHRRDAR